MERQEDVQHFGTTGPDSTLLEYLTAKFADDGLVLN